MDHHPRGEISPKLSQKSTTLFCQKGLHRNSSFYENSLCPEDGYISINICPVYLHKTDSSVRFVVFFTLVSYKQCNPSNKGDHKAIPTLGSKTQLGKIRQDDRQKAERGVKHTA